MTIPQGNEALDDKGRPCSLHVLGLPKRPAKYLRRLRNDASLHNARNMYWTEIYGLVLAGFVPLGLGAILYNAGQSPAGGGWTQGLFAASVGVALIVCWNWIPIVATSRKTETARRAIAVWTEAGLCPACGHDIALDLEKNELTPSEHGYATCPKCQAAWQTDRFDPATQAHGKDWRRQWEESQHRELH